VKHRAVLGLAGVSRAKGHPLLCLQPAKCAESATFRSVGRASRWAGHPAVPAAQRRSWSTASLCRRCRQPRAATPARWSSQRL
jgi:hypothetical protein